MLEDEALVLTDLGRYQQAEQLLQEAAAIQKAVGQKIDGNYVVPRVRLALAAGKPDEAASLAERFYGAVPDSAPLSLDGLRNLRVRAEIALAKHDGKTAILMAGRAAMPLPQALYNCI
jgi:hypothetical protein